MNVSKCLITETIRFTSTKQDSSPKPKTMYAFFGHPIQFTTFN